MRAADIADASMEDQATRILALGYVVASLLFGILTLPILEQQWRDYHLVWTAAALAVTFVLPAALLIAIVSARYRVIRGMLTAAALSFFVLVATLVPAMDGARTDGASPWFLITAIVGAAAGSMVWSTWVSWAAVLLLSVGIGIDRVLAGPAGLGKVAVQDALYSNLYGAVVVGLILLIRDAARRMDRATARAREEARATAQRQAIREEQQWLRQFLHDEVLSVFILAMRDDPALRRITRDRARHALETLDRRGAPREDTTRGIGFSVRDAVALIQEAADEISPTVVFRSEVSATWQIPAAARRALITAVGEALRNSMRHADVPGRTVERLVDVTADEEGIRIEVLDDGAGFDPGGVRWDRMGIQESILASMDRLPGGEARVTSSPGAGTQVVLTWKRQE